MTTQPPQFRPPFYKRKYLVNYRFQLTFTFAFMVFFGVAQLVLYFVLAHLLDEVTRQFESLSAPGAAVFAHIVKDSRQLWNEAFIMVSQCTLLLTFGVGILVSHRVAGPLFRLRSHLDEGARTGALMDVRFRSGDFFQDIPPAFNRFMQTLRGLRSGGTSPGENK